MDISGLIQVALQYFGQASPLAKLLSILAMVLVGLPAVVTALVTLWHAVAGVVSALAAFLPGLSKLADALKADQAVIDDKSNKLLALINRLSAILPPVKQS